LPREHVGVKRLFIKYASWIYRLSAALLFCGVVICIVGWHFYFGVCVAIVGFGLGVVTDAIVPRVVRRKDKD
jgi:hypothetical protein